ncbi:flagellar export protein FliJ [Caminibacter sp.]
MKTKFDSIVKIKKQQIEKIERDIQKINRAILDISKKIDSLRDSLLKFSLPKSGNFSKIIQAKEMQNIIKQEIKNYESQINMLQNRKKELLEELKKANLEYEKMKYLQGEEIKKEIKKMRLKEARDMDEIAILLENGKIKKAWYE